MEAESFEPSQAVSRMERAGRWAGAVGLGVLVVGAAAERVFGVSTELFEVGGQSINSEIAGGFGLLAGSVAIHRAKDHA